MVEGHKGSNYFENGPVVYEMLIPCMLDNFQAFLLSDDHFQINHFENSETPSVFVYFVALSPKSTAMAMAGRSVHLTTLFPGQA